MLHFTCLSDEDQNSREKKAEEKAWDIQRENVVVRVGFTEVVYKPRCGKSVRTSHINVTIWGRSFQAKGTASAKP